MGIVAGLLVVSYLLYMVDVWATDRIDGLLLAHYGPELYERYTTALHEVRSNIYIDQNLRFTIATYTLHCCFFICRNLFSLNKSLNGRRRMR